MIRDVLAGGIEDVLSRGWQIESAYKKWLQKNPKLGSKQRRMLAETLYSAVRWIRPILHHVSLDWNESWQQRPDGSWIFTGLRKLNEKEWRLVAEAALELGPKGWPPSCRGLSRAETFSVSDFLLTQFDSSFEPNDCDLELSALNQPAPIYLRSNQFYAHEKMSSELRKKIEAMTKPVDDDQVPDAFQILDRRILSVLQKEAPGAYEVQDLSSQKVAIFAQPQSCSVVIDGCAGRGGKTLHLASLMNRIGKQIIALDIDESRLLHLRKRARLAKVEGLQVSSVQNTKFLNQIEGSADLLILDLPCSGSGVLRRNVEDKYKINEGQLESLVSLQRDILIQQARFLKPSGRMIFVTCSLLKRENEDQLNWFLNHQPQFELSRSETLLPSQINADGFFMAELILRR